MESFVCFIKACSTFTKLAVGTIAFYVIVSYEFTLVIGTIALILYLLTEGYKGIFDGDF